MAKPVILIARRSSQSTDDVLAQHLDYNEVHINSNFRDALIDLYCSGLGNYGSLVDAVLIGQERPAEKNLQVLLMCEFYSKAQTAIILLGTIKKGPEGFMWLKGHIVGLITAAYDQHSEQDIFEAFG
ncbi:hypothetical protein ColTof4_07603 [Colletotrichum tofieldiae]|nr:hypothetical protein ColTof3_12557 [Colletotrichum tofieldiae]GKT75180.1 hypothetical protein ColTof4_07603 [Colletotrichum tofieldiae]GKT92422.1 hypothetical protein Ct61P_10272 [Colletotrichum tofieldiae]